MLHLAIGSRLDRVGYIAQEHLHTGGKRLRARLALAAIEALGGERSAAIGWAAACELLHNATLVHDDLQDGDRVRRGQPTTWARFGKAQAVNAGDLLLMLPFQAIDRLECHDEVKWSLSRAMSRRAAATVRGQALELDLLRSGRVDDEAWSRAAEGKSGELLALPVEGAALLSELSVDSAVRLGDEFLRLGEIYQLQDDLLDLFGDKGRGIRGNDLREGKVSAVVVAHLALHPGDSDELLALLGLPRHKTPDVAVEAFIERFRAGGAMQAVQARIEAMELATRNSCFLRSIPEVHRLALELIQQVRRTLKVSK